MKSVLRLAIVSSLLVLLPAPAPARADGGEPTADLIGYRMSADSYFRLFERSMAEAIGGAIEMQTGAPLYQQASLRIRDVDVPWAADSVDMELAAWGQVQLVDTALDGRRIDGDINLAYVRHRLKALNLTFGRQVVTAGAARFARLDGVAIGVRAPWGLGANAYGGLSVLPRWSARPGYVLLGSAADTLLRDPALLSEPRRQDHWLIGGRVHYQYAEMVEAGLSFHEQREYEGLARRDAAVDVRLSPLSWFDVSGRAIVDVDGGTLSDARALVQLRPHARLTVLASYQHLVPSLLLSRQAVLSVFSTAAFDEWGSEAQVKALRELTVAADGYMQRFNDGELGARFGARARYYTTARGQLSLTASYRRIFEGERGYHSLRTALALTPTPSFRIALDGYGYFYDEPINGVATSWLGAISGRWDSQSWWATVLSTSVTRSPYAAFDTQLLARLSIKLEGGGR